MGSHAGSDSGNDAPSGIPKAAFQLLQGLDLTSTELRAYEYLLRAGSATPTAIARETGQSRGRIYETLRILVEKGLVREEPTRPIQYLPVPLAEVLDFALAEANRRASLIRQAYAEIAQSTETPPAPAGPVTRPSDFTVFSGRRALVAEMRRIVARAKQRILIEAGGRFAPRLAQTPELLQALADATDRGVTVEVHVPGDPTALEAVRALQLALGQDQVRVLGPGWVPLATRVASESCVFIVLAQPDDLAPLRGEDVAIRAESARLAQDMLRVLMTALDAAPERSPPARHVDAESAGREMEAVLAKARYEVLGMGPKGWSGFVQNGGEALIRTYDGVKARGVSFRGLTVDAPEERDAMAPFLSVWNVRVTPWIPVWLTIIDREKLFQVFPPRRPGEAPEIRVSANEAELRFFLDLFERLWGDAQPLERTEGTRANVAT